MTAANLIWRNAMVVKKHLDAVEKKRVKAAMTATKVEGFRLRNEMKKELRSGRISGKRLKPLSQIARRTKTGRIKKNARRPLATTARLIRYKATTTKGKMNVEVGYVGPMVEKRHWKELMIGHQEGYSVLYGKSRKELGKQLARIGGKLKKRKDPDARFFFLTKKAGAVEGRVKTKLPARLIVDPFWEANRSKAQNNITRDWERKMAGERI